MHDFMTIAGMTSCPNNMSYSWLKLISRQAKVVQAKKLEELNFLANLLLVDIKEY